MRLELRRLGQSFGHGRYAPGQIRSPADQRLADAAPLYEKYKLQELQGEAS